MDSSASASASNAYVKISPLLLKTGIPLAISVAGFFCAKIITRRNIILENKASSDKITDFDSTSSTSEEENISSTTHFMNSPGTDKFDFNEQEILSLRHQVEELQKKEMETKLQLVRYHDLKEQESLLVELKNMLLLEKAYVELLDREILSTEAESKRLDNLVVQYLTVPDQLQHWKSETGLLQSKVKKLLRKTKQNSRIVREKNLKIEAVKAELLRNRNLIETSSDAISQLENQVKEQQSVIDQLEEKKNELLFKLDQLSASPISKNEDDYEETSTMEDYKQLLNDYEQLEKERADEVKELIYLRWTNACLRHELMRNHAEQEQEQEKKSIEQFVGCGDVGMEQVEEACLINDSSNGDAFSKRKKLLKKMKRWVEGSEKIRSKFGEKETEDHSHTITIPARKSCSSA